VSATRKSAFAREATGLVREFSWFDAFIISSSVVLPSVWSYSSQIAFVASADPGADIVTSEHLGLLFTLPLAIVYVLLSASMPRAGGDYIWISRNIHPIVGFMAGWSFWIAIVSVFGTEGVIFGSVIVPDSLAALGYGLDNSYLVNLSAALTSTIAWVFTLGLILIIVTFLITMLRPRIFSRVMMILFALIMLGTVVSFFVLASSSHSDFVNAINGVGGTTYSGIIAKAQSLGWSFVPVTTSITLLSTPLAVLLYNGQNYSAAVSGEVRSVRRSMPYAIVGSLVFAWIINVIGTVLSLNVVGYQFIQASLFLGSKWPLVAPPWMPLFIAMLNHNAAVLLLVQLGWLITFFWNLAGFLLVATRYVFAFSFDRVFPTSLSDISSRFHNPIKSLVLNLGIAVAFLVVATFTSFIGLFLNSVAIWSIVWFLASLVAVVFPYKKKDIAQSLPGGGWKIPFLTIIGVVSMVLMAINLYFSVTTPAIGPSTPQADVILATIFITGLVVYSTSYYFRKRGGIDIRLVYSELPPE
jgi:APA family basic amino acid/polyamine antiporter